MKKIILSLLALPMLFACSNEADQMPQEAGRVPLQIELGGITRATVLDALPVECTYGVFATTTNSLTTSALAEDGANRRVTYVNGKSTFDVPVFIPENGSIYVRAYYPYNANLTQYAITNGIALDTKSQTDYLITTSSYVATESNPTVKLTMQHAMARIHVTINKAASNASTYIFKEIALNDVLMQGTYGFNGSVSIDDSTGTVTAYPTNIYLNEAGDNIEVDFLVLPVSWSRTMRVSLPNSGYEHLTTTLPSRSYNAGQQYNITLTINHKSELEAGEWTIVPWDSQYKGGLSIWKDDKK